MCSIQSDRIDQIRDRVTRTGAGWEGEGIVGFIHPKRLHGLLLGLVPYDDWNARRPLPENDDE